MIFTPKSRAQISFVALRPAGVHQLNFTLMEAVSIAGTVRMLDGTTPHVALPVEAVEIDNQTLTIDMTQEERLNPNVAATVLSNKQGIYQFVNLLPGVYLVRCQTRSGFIYYKIAQKTPYIQCRGMNAVFLSVEKF